MRKIVFIVNKNSVKRHAQALSRAMYPVKKYDSEQIITRAISKKFPENEWQVSVKYTQYAGHATFLSREAVNNNVDIVVAVGGDGTVNEVAAPLINSESTLGIVPMGSGNGLARHLGIPRNIGKAAELIANAKTSVIDTCTVNDKPFVSIAGVGFDAHVADLFAKGTRRGFLGYFHIIANEYLHYKPQNYKLVFKEDKEVKANALFIAFANSNQFGYNTTIAPNATLVDGLIDVCIVQKPDIYKLPLIANLLLLRKLDLSPDLSIIKTKEVCIYRKNNSVVNIDGEPISFKKKLTIKINPLSLKIIINPDVSKV